MPRNPPSLRLHSTGQWFCKWAGRFHYFGTRYGRATEKYAESLREWQAWNTRKQEARRVPAKLKLLVIDLHDKFLATKGLEGSSELEAYYRRQLRRFTDSFGGSPPTDIAAADLQALKEEMLLAGFAPKTINHDLIAVKGMFIWAADMGMIAPINLRGCKTIPLGPPPDKSLPVNVVQTMIRSAPDHIAAWLGANYLTAARPTEIVRIVNDQGAWTDPGVFRLDTSKMAKRTRMPRHVVFSDLALEWLARCEPVWGRLDSYSSAVRRVCGPGGPHPLRHSAATHLVRLGAARADVDLILGHLPGRVSLTYAPIDWQALRAVSALLTL